MADIQCYVGHLYLAQAEPQQALAHFEQAQRLCGPIALHRAIEALSYQAVAYLALGQIEPALDCSGQAIDWLLKRKGGLEAAQRVYLNHYRVLLTSGLAAQAQAALATAHKMVLAQAAELAPAFLAAESTDMVRERFLTHLPWNREIMATAERVLLFGQSY